MINAGSQAVISLVLQRELDPEPLYLVAEEVSKTYKESLMNKKSKSLCYLLQKAEDLQKNGSEAFLESITKLVNDALASDESYADSSLSMEDVRKAIDHGRSQGGSNGRHWILDPIDGTKG